MEVKVRTWGGLLITDEPDEEEPLTVDIMVQVPLETALRFEQERGAMPRGAFFGHLLSYYCANGRDQG